jgi:serine/threonine protein kinase
LSSEPLAAKVLKKCPLCHREYIGQIAFCAADGTLLMAVNDDPILGSVLQGKYRVLAELGRGGMSIVYKAHHEMMDKMVAIKMLHQDLTNDQNSIKRFQQEAQAASCLAHQNVITIFDFGVSPAKQPYLVMDFLAGLSLQDEIRAKNHISPRRAAKIFIQCCDALEHAHQKGVLHRDLKSSNIMLIDYDGDPDFVKVVDFGIAKLMPSSGITQQNLTQTGEVFGSPVYMSPEQCLGTALDGRSDIYSMGACLYEALTGRPPLVGENIIDTMQMHCETIPAKMSVVRPDLSVPQSIEVICLRALEKAPENRFASMGEFKQALTLILPGLLSYPAENEEKTDVIGQADSHLMGLQSVNATAEHKIEDRQGIERGILKPSPVVPTLDRVPSKRVNSDYSDILPSYSSKASDRLSNKNSKEPQAKIYAPAAPRNNASLIIMIVLGAGTIFLVIAVACYAFLQGHIPVPE